MHALFIPFGIFLIWAAGLVLGLTIKEDTAELPQEPEVITVYIERCSDPEPDADTHIDELYSAHEHYRRM